MFKKKCLTKKSYDLKHIDKKMLTKKFFRPKDIFCNRIVSLTEKCVNQNFLNQIFYMANPVRNSNNIAVWVIWGI